MIRVLEEVYDGGWTTAGEIIVKRDGGYHRVVVHNLGTTNRLSEKTDGHLPDPLMHALAKEVEKNGFETIEGVPTYRYGIDDYHIRHPAAIGQLLKFVSEKGETKQ